MIKLDDDNFESSLGYLSKRMLFLLVSAHDCKPCQKMRPIVGNLEAAFAAEQMGWAWVCKRESPELVAELGVKIVPTYIFYKMGLPLVRIRGSCSEDTLRNYVSRWLGYADSFGFE